MNKTMQAVGVIPGRKEVSLIDHQTPYLTEDHHVKVRVLDVGICGTDREICTFVYGRPPAGSEMSRYSVSETGITGDSMPQARPTRTRTCAPSRSSAGMAELAVCEKPGSPF